MLTIEHHDFGGAEEHTWGCETSANDVDVVCSFVSGKRLVD